MPALSQSDTKILKWGNKLDSTPSQNCINYAFIKSVLFMVKLIGLSVGGNMRNKLILSLSGVLALLASNSAMAAATVAFGGGVGGIQPGETLYSNFDGTTVTPTGSGFQIAGPDGNAARPAFGSTGNFLAVLAGGSALFTFAGGLSELGFDYGSADSYNTFTLGFASGPNQVLTGDQIITIPPADGNQGVSRTNGRVTITTGAGPALTSLRIQSSLNSAEVDNFGVRSAVPEPATWAMMLVGFGAAGISMRRRRNIVAMQIA